MKKKETDKSAHIQTASTAPMPVLFIGHGTPMNAIEDNEFSRGWRKVAESLPRPKAILCISAHWETWGALVTGVKKPRTIHDFGGFPQELFDVQYPAPGSQWLVTETISVIKATKVGMDEEWGLDHGCWSVLKQSSISTTNQSAGTISNCVITACHANNDGGGLYNSSAIHCTIVSNGCWGLGGGTGYRMIVTICIIYHNRSFVMGTDHNNYLFQGSYGYNCTYPDPGGSGNVTNDPQFADFNGRDFRLTASSPCVDAATNVGLSFDLAGVPRPLDDGNTNGVAVPDMGAYEFAHPFGDTDGDGMTDPWELLYGLSPTNAADAGTDSDGDGISNHDEWIADTSPTSVQTHFEIAAVSNMPSFAVYFPSSSNRHYSLEYTTNLIGAVWTNVPGQTNLLGMGGAYYISDTNFDGCRYYRVRAIFP